MKKITLLFFLLIAVVICNAQPMYDWVKRSTSTGQLAPLGIAVDASGNVYTTGGFVTDADFDPGSGTQILTSAGSADIFITKRNATGAVLWAKRIGDVNSEEGAAIALDASGNVYVTGTFTGTIDFDPGPAIHNLSRTSTFHQRDIFVVKLDASGDYVWAKSMAGDNSVSAYSITIDAADNVYTTGGFSGTVDFDPGPGVQNLQAAIGSDIYISKLNSSGDYVWVKSVAGSNNIGNAGQAITVDALGNVYTTGYFTSNADFDPGSGTEILTVTGNYSAFVLKLNASGDYVWAKKIGGDLVLPSGIAVDASGGVYSTGSFRGMADFDPDITGTQNLTPAGREDIYISKLDASGNYVWATRMGDTDDDYAGSIKVDAAGNVYTTGYFAGTIDVDPGAATNNLVDAGDGDGYIVKLTTSGNYAWATNIGGTNYDAGIAIAVTSPDNIYLVGTFDGTADFDPGTGTQDLTSAGEDTYILHLIPSGTLPLTLLNFEAVDNNTSVLLKWQTTREENMTGFAIERSADGKQFETIGSVTVNNSFNLVNNYAFTDAHPLNGKSFYRLRITDLDGSFTYSRIIPLRKQGTAQGVQVFPSPATNVLYVNVDAQEAVSVQIADVAGRVWYQQNKTIHGNTTFPVSIQGLPAGNYYLILKGKSTQKTRQFLKQ